MLNLFAGPITFQNLQDLLQQLFQNMFFWLVVSLLTLVGLIVFWAAYGVGRLFLHKKWEGLLKFNIAYSVFVVLYWLYLMFGY